jgi:hypothetical protein
LAPLRSLVATLAHPPRQCKARCHAIGRGQNPLLAHGAAVVVVIGLAYLLAPRLVLAPFIDVDDPAYAGTVALATNLLVVAAVLQFADCAQNLAGAASGLVNVAHQLGGSLGPGILVTVFAAAGGGLAHRVAAALTVGAAMLALALVVSVALIVRPHRTTAALR